MSNTIQQRFQYLLQATTALFTTQHGSSKEERTAFDNARSGALSLASEAKHPQFENFLAYLLGVTSIDGDYPLQAIRMLTLTAQVMTRQPPTADVNLDDLYTAAYIADLGFRSSWIGQKGAHAEIAAYRIKGISFSWFNPVVEKLILEHHQFSADVSPQHCLSLIAHYLGLVYDLGTDVTTNNPMAPSKALETLLQEYPTALANIKFLLKSISAFPLGSWVALNSGDPALVIGANPDNPLRPKIGYFRKSKNGLWAWEEHLLQKEPTVHIASALTATSLQRELVNRPHLWIKNWEGEGTFSDVEFSEIFRRNKDVVENKSSASAHASSDPIWLTKSSAPASPHESGATSNAVGPNVSDKELQKLRVDWETNVHHIEECVAKLKSGLIDSYRRENERYREALEHLVKNPPTAIAAEITQAPENRPGIYQDPEPAPAFEESAPRPEKKSSALGAQMDGKMTQIETEMQTRQDQFKTHNDELQQSFNAVKALLGKYLSDLPRLPAAQAQGLRTVITKTQGEMASAEQGLLRIVRLPMASLNELRVQWESAKTLCHKFHDDLEKGGAVPTIENVYASQWKETFEPAIEASRKALAQEWADRLERWAQLQQLIGQFQELVDLLRDKLPNLEGL